MGAPVQHPVCSEAGSGGDDVGVGVVGSLVVRPGVLRGSSRLRFRVGRFIKWSRHVERVSLGPVGENGSQAWKRDRVGFFKRL